MRVMRVRVLVLGGLLSAVIVAGLLGVSATIPPYSLMPSMASLSSFGFPASMLEPQGYFQQTAVSPETMIGLTSNFLPDSASEAAFSGLMPGTSSAFSGFPMMPGIGSFTSPVDYASQVPMMSSLAFPGVQMPSMALQPSTGSPGVSPSASNNYTEASNGKTITIKQGDIIHVQLPSRIDQGYIWNISVSDGLNVTSTRMYPPEQINPISSSGEIVLRSIQEWDVQAIKPGTQNITAVYKRPWADGPGDRTYMLTVIVV
jgi:predicted secreted protein